MIGETVDRNLVLSTEYLEVINRIFNFQCSIFNFHILEGYYDW